MLEKIVVHNHESSWHTRFSKKQSLHLKPKKPDHPDLKPPQPSDQLGKNGRLRLGSDQVQHQHPHNSSRWNRQRQLTLHLSRLHRLGLEPLRLLQLAHRRSILRRHPQNRRGPRHLPRLLLQLLPLLQPRRLGHQTSHSDLQFG